MEGAAHMRALLIGIAHRNMIDIDSNVKALEECVGGNIEKIKLKDGGVMIANKEGMKKQYPRNDLASYISGKPLYGAVLIVGTDGDDFDDVEQKYVDAYLV